MGAWTVGPTVGWSLAAVVDVAEGAVVLEPADPVEVVFDPGVDVVGVVRWAACSSASKRWRSTSWLWDSAIPVPHSW